MSARREAPGCVKELRWFGWLIPACLQILRILSPPLRVVRVPVAMRNMWSAYRMDTGYRRGSASLNCSGRTATLWRSSAGCGLRGGQAAREVGSSPDCPAAASTLSAPRAAAQRSPDRLLTRPICSQRWRSPAWAQIARTRSERRHALVPPRKTGSAGAPGDVANVLDAVLEHVGWWQAPAPDGRGVRSGPRSAEGRGLSLLAVVVVDRDLCHGLELGG
jgi:hypothetical protein